MAWYNTGNIALTNGSATVTGSGTNFLVGAQIGEALYAPDGKLYEIQTIDSATVITLASNYLGSTASAQGYQIIPTQSLVADLASDVTDLISDFADVRDYAGNGKFNDGAVGTPGITFTQDQDNGLYRIGSNNWALAAGGQQVVNLTTTAMNFPDNNKAIFGAGSDLQIYHDGDNSYINDSGVGDLKLGGNQLQLNNAAQTRNYIYAVDEAQVELKYNNALKLATTATGIDVTGLVTASNSLVITGGITGHGANRATFSQEGAGGAYIQSYGANTSTMGAFVFRQASSDFSVTATPLTISATGAATFSGTVNGLTLAPSAFGNRWGVTAEVASNGVMEVGRYIDFHFTDGDTSDYGARLDYDGTNIVSTNSFYMGSGIYLGGSVAANLLDDYETGTWTPTVNFEGTSTGVTYTKQLGHYTKIGRMVYASFDILLSSKGTSTGGVTIDGLPIANYGSHQNNAGTVICESGGVDWPQTNVYGMVWSDGNIYLRQQGTTAYAAVTNENFSNTTKIFGMMVYEAT